ncbi:MAG: YchJ family protein [Saccharospirillaceae bacterium]|nr:YchJ family protein [Pseudomonadales bacterium]NRB80221.1 YchJ family protein [Saccharospirillaceae bacterium]
MSDQICFCDSLQLFKDCCEPFLSNTSKPDTCEQLMRSRYSAYVTANIDYLIQTTAEESREESDAETMKQWAQQANWIKLELINASENQVEFKAYYILGNKLEAIHETSDFIKENDSWVYLDGDAHMHVYDIGRNEPCPCKSGKKFKKCCYK